LLGRRGPRMTGFPPLAGAPSSVPCRKFLSLQVIYDEDSTHEMPSGSKRLDAEPRLPPIKTTRDADWQALLEAGATGLEPAPSGVTGRYGRTGYERLRPGFTV